MALEPRWLFDGAAGVTADAVLADGGPGADAFAAPPGHDGGQQSSPAAPAVATVDGGAVPGEGATEHGSAVAALTAPAEGSTVDGVSAPSGSSPAGVSVDVAKGSFDSVQARDAAVAADSHAVRQADAGDVDAGDDVYFVIQVSNTGADAWDLQLVDTLPPGIEAGDVTGLSLHDSAGNVIDFHDGTVIRDAGTGEPITTDSAFAQALFGDGVEFIDPSADQAFFSRDGCGVDGVTIRYQVQVADDAVAGSVICAQAEVTHVAASECGSNVLDCGPLPGDGASISIAGASVQTAWVATSADHTAGGDVAVGEVATYRTTITVPEGSSPGAVVIQDLGPGLTLVSVDSITLSDGVTSSRQPDPGGIDAVDADGGRANRFTIDFGTVTNANRDNGATETIVIEFQARTENVQSNQQGVSLGARADYSSRESDCGDVIVRAGDCADPLQVVEPQVQMTIAPLADAVPAGEVATFEVRVTNDGAADAFDVQFDDLALPPGMTLVPGSFVQVAGPAFDVPAGWAADGQTGEGPAGARLGAGETAVFQVQVVVAPAGQGGSAPGAPPSSGDAASLALPATVRYTSLPGPDAAAERTGADGRGGLNDYVANASGQVAVVAPPVAPPVSPPVGPPVAPPVAPPEGPAPVEPPPAGGPPVIGVLPPEPGGSPGSTLPDMQQPTSVSEVPGEGQIAPVALAPLVDDPWLVLKALPVVAAKPAVAADDDCAPLPEPPKVIKRAPLGDIAGKPVKRGFSEQIDSAKKRFRPPAVIRTPPRDC